MSNQEYEPGSGQDFFLSRGALIAFCVAVAAAVIGLAYLAWQQ